MVTIVVVEPDFDVRALVAEWLGAEGYTVTQCSRWPSAPEVLRSASAMILDLPHPSLQLPPRLSDMPVRRSALPAIGLSARLGVSQGGDSALARSLNLVGVIAKPCERQELLAAVRSALARRAA
jgi:DNA-binding response OmpR family regulator